MLILTRKPKEGFMISPVYGEGSAAELRAMFGHWPVWVWVQSIRNGRVSIGIDAPESVKVLRSELVLEDPYARWLER